MMMTQSQSTIKLRDHQVEAVEKLRTGSILLGGVGSGKTLTSLAYFYKHCGGSYKDLSKPTDPKDLYVITTARKRDTLDWEREAAFYAISKDRESSVAGIKLHVDSWNNIKKYLDVENAFFIFDEQRVVGSGVWAKTFVKISKKNDWILLTATPGDTWMDYISVFLANGFYKNKTAFIREHVVYSRFVSFPKVQKYLNVEKLKRLRDKITVHMPYEKDTIPHNIDIIVPYDKEAMKRLTKDRWNIFEDRPLKNGAELNYNMRKLVNSHPDRVKAVRDLAIKHGRVIVFYNFDYELDILRTLENTDFTVAEYNGHLHQDIPKSKKWIYLVQYLAGAEAWNCVDTNVIAFYSLNYSYRLTTQSAGRIDRLNTPFQHLYYYFIQSESIIDKAIISALKSKTDFNERCFLRGNKLYF